MNQPPRDDIGVLPHDHDEIICEDLLIRHIHPDHVIDENGSKRLSSAAFTQSSPHTDPRNSVSVELKRLLLEEGKAPLFNAKQGNGYAELSTECVRKIGLKVGWDPLHNNIAHAGIWGVGKNKSIRRELAQKCTTFLEMP